MGNTAQAINLPFDPEGTQAANHITGEEHPLTTLNSRDEFFIVPDCAPYFLEGLTIKVTKLDGTVLVLENGRDYLPTHRFLGASKGCAKEVYGSLVIMDSTLNGVVTLDYQALGGTWTVKPNQVIELLSNTIRNPRITSYEQVVDLPYAFPPISHSFSIDRLVGMKDVVEAIKQLASNILVAADNALKKHMTEVNPHGITCQLIGAVSTTEINTIVQTQATNILENYVASDRANTTFTYLGTASDGIMLAPNKSYYIDSRDRALSFRLPYDTVKNEPKLGDIIKISDLANTFDINNVTINGNSKNIDGKSTFVCQAHGGEYVLWFDGNQWTHY